MRGRLRGAGGCHIRLRDPDDEVYQETAEAGSAVLVTGNKRDFTEQRYGSVECPEQPAVPELLGKLEF